MYWRTKRRSAPFNPVSDCFWHKICGQRKLQHNDEHCKFRKSISMQFWVEPLIKDRLRKKGHCIIVYTCQVPKYIIADEVILLPKRETACLYIIQHTLNLCVAIYSQVVCHTHQFESDYMSENIYMHNILCVGCCLYRQGVSLIERWIVIWETLHSTLHVLNSLVIVTMLLGL